MPVATVVSSIAGRQLSDGNLVGTCLGTGSTDVIGFYGTTTGVAQFSFSTGVTMQSISSGALASTLAYALNRMGLILCTSIVA